MPSVFQHLSFFEGRRAFTIVACLVFIGVLYNVLGLSDYRFSGVLDSSEQPLRESADAFLPSSSVGSSDTYDAPSVIPASSTVVPTISPPSHSSEPDLNDGKFHWQNVRIQHPASSTLALPTAQPTPIPRIQYNFAPETEDVENARLQRLSAVKEAFEHAWNGYKTRAWMADEVAPLSGGSYNFFGGWAASLVDALDTLWIMDMQEEFAEAVHAIETIDFTTTEESTLNTFETTIRYMGGFLGAYDLSNGQYPGLLAKAKELGGMLLVAFDTPNRMPITRWDWRR